MSRIFAPRFPASKSDRISWTHVAGCTSACYLRRCSERPRALRGQYSMIYRHSLRKATDDSQRTFLSQRATERRDHSLIGSQLYLAESSCSSVCMSAALFFCHSRLQNYATFASYTCPSHTRAHLDESLRQRKDAILDYELKAEKYKEEKLLCAVIRKTVQHRLVAEELEHSQASN